MKFRYTMPMTFFVEVLVVLLVAETCCGQVFWEIEEDIYESEPKR